MDKKQKLQLLRDTVKSYPDFPKPGVVFRDVFPIFRNMTAFRAMRDLLMEHVLFLDIDFVVGTDSRGFLFGPMICLELGKPFLPIRKKGKLPGNVLQQSCVSEYGEATFEVQTECIQKGAKLLVVDDLLATGGSMAAAVQLLRQSGAEVVECLVIIELNGLKGRERLDVPVHSLIQYD